MTTVGMDTKFLKFGSERMTRALLSSTSWTQDLCERDPDDGGGAGQRKIPRIRLVAPPA